MNRFDVKAVLDKPDRFETSKHGDYEPTCKAELVKEEDEHHLPRLHFSWRQEVMLMTSEKTEIEKLAELGFTMEEHKDQSGESYSVGYALAKKSSHLWFCNFRRYGWAWTPDEDGEFGYGSGPIYANGHGFYSNTEAEVVRDSFIEAWTQLSSKELLPSAFFRDEVYELLKWLLSDAMGHISRHADVRRGVNAAYNPQPITVVGP